MWLDALGVAPMILWHFWDFLIFGAVGNLLVLYASFVGQMGFEIDDFETHTS